MKRRGWKAFLFFLTVILAASFMAAPMVRADDDPDRGAHAYEEGMTCVGGICTYTGRQWTSQYDLMRGQMFPNMNISYSTFDPMGMMTGSSSSTWSGSGAGGLFTGPMMQFPTSPMSYMMGTMGAPQYSYSESYNPWTGPSMNANFYEGFGSQGSGLTGPYSLMFGGFGAFGFGGSGGGYGYPGGYGGTSAAWGGGGYGYPNYIGGGVPGVGIGGWGGGYPYGGGYGYY